MPGNVVSLYINDVSMRLMVTRGKRVVKLAETPLDISLADIDTEEKEAQLAEKIKNLFKSNKISARKIVLGLSGLHCLTRPLVLPELPRAMLTEAITRESQRVLPVPLDQLYLSWQIVSTTGENINAYVVALPREIADMLIRIVNQAGYKPYLMDIKPLALARLAKENNAIIIDVQAKEFDIIFIVDKIPQPIRTVAFPSEELSLQEKYKLIADELKRTVQFLNKNDTEKSIQADTTMYISGELATDRELYESLSVELDFKVALLTSPLKTLKELDVSNYLINVGLTLKEIPKESGPVLPNINVLPTPYQPKQVSMNQVLTVPAVALAIALVVMMVMSVQDTAANIDEMNNQVLTNNFTLEKKLAQKRALVSNIADLQGVITATDAQYAVYSDAYIQMSKTGNLMNTDLVVSVDNTVDDLSLLSISHSGTQINISGTAVSEQEVLEYVRNLLATGRFDEITIASIVRDVQIVDGEELISYSFSLRCYVKESRP